MLYRRPHSLSRKHFLVLTAVSTMLNIYDDVIKWKNFPRYWPFVRGIHRSPMNSPHKGQWRGPLMFSLICTWISGSVKKNREARDLRRHRAPYEVTVMVLVIGMFVYGCLVRVQRFEFISLWIKSLYNNIQRCPIHVSKLIMTSSNGNIFRVTGPLCGEYTGHRWIPLTKASDADLWSFLWFAPE